MPALLPLKWIRACCGLLALLLVAGLLWNPAGDIVAETGLGHGVMAEVDSNADQPHRDVLPATADAPTRFARITVGRFLSGALGSPPAGPVFPPPERPPRA